MKFLEKHSDLKDVKKALKNATYLINSRAPGTANVYFMFTENRLSFDYWFNGDADDGLKHPCIMAYGDENAGNVIIYNVDEQFTAELFGTGEHHSGCIVYVQRKDDVYTVIYNKDLAESKHCFKMDATDDDVIIQIILLLLAELFPTIDDAAVNNALSILNQRNPRKEDADGKK
jgi:hypothetical protein